MQFGSFFDDPDKTRYCFVRMRLLQVVIKDDRFLDGLLERLDVPGKSLAALKKLKLDEKFRLIEGQIEHFRNTKTSLWYGVPAPEVLAASIYQSRLTDKVVNELFFNVSRENLLLQPVANWLESNGYEPYAEIPFGTKRIDVLGFKKGGFLSSDRLVGVELKNDVVQFERALDQMTTFGQYTHLVYLACTPGMAADYLSRHAESRGVHHWDSNVLAKKLESFGFGMLLVEGPNVYEICKPTERQPQASKLKEVTGLLATNLRV